MAPPDQTTDFELSTGVLALGLLLATTVVAGGLGTFQYLSRAPAYAGLSQTQLAVESLLAAATYLVVGTGPFPAQAEAPLLVYVGRGAGVLFFSSAALLGAVRLFSTTLQPYRVGLWDRLGGEASHLVVCGLGTKGYGIAMDALADGRRVVAIDPDGDSTHAEAVREAGGVVVPRDAAGRRTLAWRAKAHRADEVFVNCGGDRENTRVAQTLSEVVADRRSEDDPLRCHVHIESRSRRQVVSGHLQRNPSLLVHTYAATTATARELLDRRPVLRDGDGDESRVHSVLVGWTRLTRAVLFELHQTMHYGDDLDRQITVACADPAAAAEAWEERVSATNPDRWDDDVTAEFVERLFPSVSFVRLPSDDGLFHSDQCAVYEALQDGDAVTVVVDGGDDLQSSALAERMRPTLEAYSRERDLDVHVSYVADADPGSESAVSVESEAITVAPFGTFVDGCSRASVRGGRRDRIAKQVALLYHVLYDDPLDDRVRRALAASEATATDPGYEAATALWAELPTEELRPLADAVWRELPEALRDANRYAADHVAVKRRLADRWAGDRDDDEIVDRLAAIEHRRWCAQKFLAGWEPVPEERLDEWIRDSDPFRERKYHGSLRPLTALADGEYKTTEELKDRTQVRFILDHFGSS